MLNKGEDIAVTYERDGKQYDTVIKPIYDESAGRYYMGLYGVGSYQKFGIFGTVNTACMKSVTGSIQRSRVWSF